MVVKPSFGYNIRMIDPASIESLKQSIDIVDVIGGYLELKKAGANYKANCPFHGEKTPSFVVSPAKQIYHCFGCGAGGDSIKFVMEIEKLSYPEAIEKLASQYNFSLNYTRGTGDYSEARRILELMQQWYCGNLDRNPHAREYLEKRGITHASIEDFGIGYVPSSEEVMRYLNSRHIPLPAALDAGIVAESDTGGRYYARLANRITFPIYTSGGALAGFGGRTLGDHPAKYINSPQTRLFNKSRLLYGYYRAKEWIYKSKEVIVCEGYLDVVMLHQAGFNNAVATLGTALTGEHLPLLNKGEPSVVLAYDGDKAGRSAALKASRLLASRGMDGFVVLFPEGKDPADMVHSGGKGELRSLLKNGEPIINFVLSETAASYDISIPKEKEKAFAEMKSFLDTLSPITREGYLSHAASMLGTSPMLFGRERDNSAKIANTPKVREDPIWQRILKTMLENDRVVDDVLDIVSPEMTGFYKDAFEALIAGDRKNERLLRIDLDENIKPMKEDELYRALTVQMEVYYRRRLRDITRDKKMPYEKKSFLIRKIKTDILPRLKRGEIVPYESDITV